MRVDDIAIVGLLIRAHSLSSSLLTLSLWDCRRRSTSDQLLQYPWTMSWYVFVFFIGRAYLFLLFHCRTCIHFRQGTNPCRDVEPRALYVEKLRGYKAMGKKPCHRAHMWLIVG